MAFFSNGEYTKSYDVSNLPSGVYFLQIIINGQQNQQVFKL